MDEYSFKKCNFYITLDILTDSPLYEYRFKILKYLYGNFIIFKVNNQKELFIENNILQKSIFFQDLFKNDNIYHQLNFKITPSELYIVKSIIYNKKLYNPFILSYIQEYSFQKLKDFQMKLKKLDLCHCNNYEKIIMYLEYIEISYPGINIKDILIKYLIDMSLINNIQY